jgi:hypothetical protein
MNRSDHSRYIVGHYYFTWNFLPDDSDVLSTWVYLGQVDIDPAAPASEQFPKHRFQLVLKPGLGDITEVLEIEIFDDDPWYKMLTEEEYLKRKVSNLIAESRRKQHAAALGISIEVVQEPDPENVSYFFHTGRRYRHYDVKNSMQLRESLGLEEPVDLLLIYPVSDQEIKLIADFPYNLGLTLGSRTEIKAYQLAPLAEKKNLKYFSMITAELPEPRSEFLKWLETCTAVEKISLIGPKFTDDIGDSLRNLPQLLDLELRYTKITEEILFDLQACNRLLTLDLSENRKLTDRDFEIDRPWPLLRELNLRNTSISDRAVAALQHIPLLESLHLEKTKITDNSLPTLKQMTQLKSLNIRGTNVSFQGALDLIHSLQDCLVYC